MKPQLLSLVKHLNQGKTITRETAWSEFNIQNLTARLSELKILGFPIVKTPPKVLHDQGRKIKIQAWKLRDALRVGDYVRVVSDPGVYIPLRGKVGQIDKIWLDLAQVLVFFSDGTSHRALKFNEVQRLAFRSGDPVSLQPTPLVIGQYHPEADVYMLLTPKEGQTLIAAASLIRPLPAQPLHVHPA